MAAPLTDILSEVADPLSIDLDLELRVCRKLCQLAPGPLARPMKVENDDRTTRTVHSVWIALAYRLRGLLRSSNTATLVQLRRTIGCVFFLYTRCPQLAKMRSTEQVTAMREIDEAYDRLRARAVWLDPRSQPDHWLWCASVLGERTPLMERQARELRRRGFYAAALARYDALALADRKWKPDESVREFLEARESYTTTLFVGSEIPPELLATAPSGAAVDHMRRGVSPIDTKEDIVQLQTCDELTYPNRPFDAETNPWRKC